MRVLLVEDARLVSEPLAHALAAQGYAVDTASDGCHGFERACGGAYDAVIFDIMLPGTDGLSLLAALRRRGIETPVILLTARGEVSDRVRGLDLGADDYLAKPFHVDELLARLRAVLRARGIATPERELEVFDVRYLPAARRLACGDAQRELSRKEGLVLEALMRGAGRPVARERLVAAAWGADGADSGHKLEVQVSGLRARLRELGSETRIRAVRDLGYAFEQGAAAAKGDE